jgi:glycosyltransferase 2 family protein
MTLNSRLKWKRWFSLALGTTITILLMVWVLRDISWRDVWVSLTRSHWGWFGVGWLAYFISYGVRALRWDTLLMAQGYQSTFGQRLVALLIGFGASSVLPAYLGEFFRAGLLHRQADVPLEASIGSVVAERMLDIGVVLGLLVLPLSLGVIPAFVGLPSTLLLIIGLTLLGGWGLCILGARRPTQTVHRLGQLAKRTNLSRLWTRLDESVLHFLGGLSALAQPRRCAVLLLETLCAWLLNGVTYWTGFLALSQHAPGFLGALFVQSGVALAIAIPATPGYVGPFEASLQVLLRIYQIPAATILSYAIALRFLMYITIPLIAMALILHLGLRNSLMSSQPSKD